MKRKALIALLCAAALYLLLVGMALADGEGYTVILDSGEGTGSPITYNSVTDGISTKDWRTVGDCEFYYEPDGSLAFRLGDRYCPQTFDAPSSEYVFAGWTGNGTYNKLIARQTTFTAKWRLDIKETPGSWEISPAEYTVDGPGHTVIPCKLESLELMVRIENGGIKKAVGISFMMFEGSLEDENGNSIPFLAAGDTVGIPFEKAYTRTLYTAGETFDMVLWIDPNDYAAAEPGVYTGTFDYENDWEYSLGWGTKGHIDLMMVVPERHTVTVNNGSGSGVYAVGASVTITADEPSYDKAFKEWSGSEGLDFTSGGATAATAAFAMPDRDVNVTAVYDTGYTLTVQNGTGTGKYAAGASVTVTANDPPEGQRFKEWTNISNSWIISGGKTTPTVTFRMPSFTHVVMAAYCEQEILPGSGTAADPWRIGSAADWDRLSAAVENGLLTDGQYFRLTDNIAVSTMLGTSANPFGGRFDGAGHTLTVSITSAESYAAPFRYISGAAFERLRVAGTVTAGADGAAGLAGAASGVCTVTDCVVAVNITATAGGGHSGFVAMCSGSTVSVTGSTFTGSITAANASYCAGFLGWQGSAADDCVYAGTMNTGSASNDFIRTNDHAYNCYSLNLIGIDRVKGKKAVAVTAGKGVTIDFGTPGAVYPTSGITAYDTGLMYNGVFCAGQGETVALDLTAAPWEGYALSYEAGAGNLEASDAGWTLTMPDEDTVISLRRTLLLATAPAVRLTADGGTDGYKDQDPDKLFDGRTDSKWCCGFDGTNWVEFRSDVPVRPTAYAMTTANDAANYLRRNPISWRLLGKADVSDGWTVLAAETDSDHLPAENCVEIFFPLTASGGYQYYRLEVTAVQSGTQLQLAEFKLVGTPLFGAPDFTLPANLTAVGESAFEGIEAMTAVDASSVTSIGLNAFRQCTGLTRIRLSRSCDIDATAFAGCGTVYVFAPAGGTTEAYCGDPSHDNCVFVPAE